MTHVDPLDRVDRQHFEILKIQDGRHSEKNRKIASLIVINLYFFFRIKLHMLYKKQHWNQFLLVVKANALKQQVSKFIYKF